MTTIGIIANPNKPGSLDLLSEIKTWLTKRDVQVLDSQSSQEDAIVRDADMVVCLGGDGTLLSVANRMREKSIPILGVNLGKVGFMTEVKKEEVYEELSSYLAGNHQTEDRLMLSCGVRGQDAKNERRFIALNDVVISREGLTRLLKVEVSISGELLTSFSGDGLIIASPTGSTAYSLSAGGAIVHPELDVLIVTPICPHASSLRPIIVGGDDRITVKLKADGRENRALLTVDGQEKFEIDDSYSVEITRANLAAKLIKSSKRTYFGTLRENFKFPH